MGARSQRCLGYRDEGGRYGPVRLVRAAGFRVVASRKAGRTLRPARRQDQSRYRQAERLTLVCDNLNTHAYASFFRAFPPAEARRLVPRVQRVFTPRHGSWLHRT